MKIIPYIVAESGAIAASGTDPEVVGAPVRVLFIGNSYTDVNTMPAIVEQLAAAAKLDRPVECTGATTGGATLQRHWGNEEFRALLKSRKWDYVVLQEQSLRPIQSPKLFLEYAKLWSDEIKPTGIRLILYLTWARRATPEKQAAYTEIYRKAAKECGATVAPVGEAWRTVREDKPGIELFAPDGSHPSQAGSYLAACVFCAVITGRSPLGLPRQLPLARIDLKPGDARFLQQAAEDAVKQERDWL